jgi:hypothetical protein
LQRGHGLKRRWTHFGDVNSLLHEEPMMAEVALGHKDCAPKNACSLTVVTTARI